MESEGQTTALQEVTQLVGPRVPVLAHHGNHCGSLVLLLLPVTEEFCDDVMEVLVRRPAGHRHEAIDLAQRDRSQDRLGRRPVTPGDQQDALRTRMQLMRQPQVLDASHRRRLSGCEQDKNVSTRRLQHLEPREGGLNRLFTDDFVVPVVSADQFSLEQLQFTQSLVDRKQNRHHVRPFCWALDHRTGLSWLRTDATTSRIA